MTSVYRRISYDIFFHHPCDTAMADDSDDDWLQELLQVRPVPWPKLIDEDLISLSEDLA